MKYLVCSFALLMAGCSSPGESARQPIATTPNEKNPTAPATIKVTKQIVPLKALGNSTIKNDSGHEVRVDLYYSSGKILYGGPTFLLDSLTLKAGEKQVLPQRTRRAEVISSGSSAIITKANAVLAITPEDEIVIK